MGNGALVAQIQLTLDPIYLKTVEGNLHLSDTRGQLITLKHGARGQLKDFRCRATGQLTLNAVPEGN